MGYDISVRFKDKDDTRAMLSFLETVQEELAQLEKTESAPFRINFSTGGEVGAYAPAKGRDTLISLHGTGIPYYAWTLCGWMAHQSEYRNKKNRPVIFYDREEIAIFDNTAAINDLRADADGILIRDKPLSVMQSLATTLKLGPDYKKQTELMRAINQKYTLYMAELQNPFQFEM